MGVGDRISDGNRDKDKTAEWPLQHLQTENVNELTFCTWLSHCNALFVKLAILSYDMDTPHVEEKIPPRFYLCCLFVYK